MAVILNLLRRAAGGVEAVHGGGHIDDVAHAIVGQVQTIVARKDAEEQLVDERRRDVEAVGYFGLGSRIADDFEAEGLLPFGTEGVSIALGEKDTMFGAKYGPGHAASDSLDGKVCEGSRSERGNVLFGH